MPLPTCPICGTCMRTFNGPSGMFVGCSAYHDTGCGYAFSLPQKMQERMQKDLLYVPELEHLAPPVGTICFWCRSPMGLKYSTKRNSFFWGCTAYPACGVCTDVGGDYAPHKPPPRPRNVGRNPQWVREMVAELSLLRKHKVRHRNIQKDLSCDKCGASLLFDGEGYQCQCSRYPANRDGSLKWFSIYGIWDSRPGREGELRCIGKTTKKIKALLQSQIRKAENAPHNSLKNKWLCEMAASSSRPRIEILERVSALDSDLSTQLWTLTALDCGYDLTNQESTSGKTT